MDAWTSVKVKAVDHPRAGEAGVVQGSDEKKKTAEVRFDLDLTTETVKFADLELL